MSQPFMQEIQINKRATLTSDQKKDAKAKMDAQYAEESKLVSGIFKNLECKGASVQFLWKKFPQDNIQCFTLEDGQKYEIPLGLAKHINNDCFMPKHSYLIDPATNKPVVGIGSKDHRYQFLSTQFM